MDAALSPPLELFIFFHVGLLDDLPGYIVVCVAWVETGPRNPQGGIIIPTHGRTRTVSYRHRYVKITTPTQRPESLSLSAVALPDLITLPYT